MDSANNVTKDFIREIIDEDLRTGKYDGRVHTRFPPEPNGYLHIGHAKSICLNFGIADEYKGLCNLRFDDTNPTKEEEEYTQSIIKDVRWLGFDWENRLFFASDYFDKMYEYAVQLVKTGKAYVDDLKAIEINEYRGTLIKPGRNSPYRDRSIEENLNLLERMKTGEFADGEKVLRAKIDMSHPNLNMRDPVIYRILHACHHRTKDKWCIYPMYDWAHGLEDSIENITHSICTLEFENHRPLYDWFLANLGVYHPQQIEFARLNLTYTVMSKRMLLELVEGKHVSGWDDPRLPTISGMRRRGYSPSAIRNFCKQIGVAKVNSMVDFDFLEHCIRDDLNKTSPRFMGVIRPLKVVIDNYSDIQEKEIEAVNNPENPSAGTRKIPFSQTLYIEQGDFMEWPPNKFYRLAPGREVRFRYAYFVTCKEVIKENDKIVELRCTVDPATYGGYAPDGRKVKSTIHWVSADHAVDAEVRLYDRLFTVINPAGQKDTDFKDFLNPNSLEILKSCKVESSLRNLKSLDRFQFERLGYFCIDPDTSDKNLIINRTVELRDTWAKIQKQQQKTT
jgi:glutaminyl-tRNA synthetase